MAPLLSRLLPGVAIPALCFLTPLCSAQTLAIQVGAYQSEAGVLAMSERLTSLRYPVVHEETKVGDGKRLTHIAVGPIPDRDEAIRTLNSLRSEGIDGFIKQLPTMQREHPDEHNQITARSSGSRPADSKAGREPVQVAFASGGPSRTVLLVQATTPEQAKQPQNALDYLADGIEAMDMEDFAAAERCFKQALTLEPANTEFQYYLGVVYVRLKKEDEAIRLFESLIRKDPKNYFKAYFDMAAAYSGQGQYQKALDTLGRAEAADPNNARVHLEKGYAHKNLKQYDQAVQSFNRAKELDPKEAQVAYYMIAAVELERERFEEADRMFNKSIEVSPNTPLAQTAKQTLPNVAMAAWARKPWYLTSSLNWGYDDNVPRNPISEITGGPVSGGIGKGDQFETFVLIGGYKFLNRKDLEIGAGYSLFSVGYRDWTQNNLTSHSPHVYFQGNFDPVYFRFQYDFSYFYSGGKKQSINPPIYLTFANNSYAKMRMHTFAPTVSILEPYNLRTDINLSYQIKDYLDRVTADASRYGADITQSYKVPGTEIQPRVGYRHAYEQSGDKSSVYRYNEFFLGVNSPIYWGITGDVAFSYMRTNYPEFSVPLTDRVDETFTICVALNRYLMERLLLSFNYLYIRNNSDYQQNKKEPYTFDKNMYLLTLTYTF